MPAPEINLLSTCTLILTSGAGIFQRDVRRDFLQQTGKTGCLFLISNESAKLSYPEDK